MTSSKTFVKILCVYWFPKSHSVVILVLQYGTL